MVTDFGFKRVEEVTKHKLVSDLFTQVSSSYDIMNDAMSFGLHRFWKHYFTKHLPFKGGKILDLASGTGDIAFGIKKRFSHLNPAITLCDLTPSMLEVAQDRSIDLGYVNGLDFVVARGESLPFADNSFDLITISFGLRNTTDKAKVIQECYRVLKPKGWFYCLEFSKIDNVYFKKVYDAYSFGVVPKMGKYIAKDEESYQYLVESIREFPDQNKLLSMIFAEGFKHASFENLSGGIVAIHKGEKQ